MANPSEPLELTSTTAPGKLFASRAELAAHYKSDWHKYNLKRREAGLPVLLFTDFSARLEAARALRQQQEEQGAGQDHLKAGKKQKNKKKSNAAKQQGATNAGVHIVSQAAAYDRIKEASAEVSAVTESLDHTSLKDKNGVTDEKTPGNDESPAVAEEQMEEEIEEINPCKSIFDSHVSATVEENADYMYRTYGFFVPDREYLTDLEGLLGYCHEKVMLGHYCLYCQRVFSTWPGCKAHMMAVRHTKLRYEADVDLEEFDVFYDFSEANKEFIGPTAGTTGDAVEVEEDGNDDEEWEDVSDEEMEAEDEDGAYDGYEAAVARMGLDVTPLGELVFPDGRIVGHRALQRYYKQRSRPKSDSAAILAVKQAAGERLYQGQVHQLGGQLTSGGSSSDGILTAMPSREKALVMAGIAPGRGQGRSAKGVLVASSSSWTAMSVYRYRAALRKQDFGDRAGRKMFNKTNRNMNKMDKKANRLHNNVSVAHAKR